MSRLSLLLLAFAFALTGVSTLIYELIWMRQASLVFGVSVYAYVAVVIAFLGGGALGNWLFSLVVPWMRQPLWLFALLQVAIAGLALQTPGWLQAIRPFYANLALHMVEAPALLLGLRLALAVLILTPTALLMGGTLPIIMHWLGRVRAVGSLAIVGRFYALETLGAAVGATVTALWLLRYLALPQAVTVAAAINLVSCVLAGLGQVWGRTSTITRSVDSASTDRIYLAGDNSGDRVPWGPRRLLGAYTLSGFIALGYQTVWSRILAIFTLDAVFSFAIVLSTFLAGLAIGSALAARHMQRRAPTLRTFARLQLFLALSGVGTVYLFYWLPLLSLEDVFGAYTMTRAILFEFLLGSLILLLPTCLMGYLYPVTVHLVTRNRLRLGTTAGQTSAVNTVGAISGILVTTFLLVPGLGLQGTLLLLAGGSLLLGLLAWPLRGLTLTWSDNRLPAGGMLCLCLAVLFRPPAVYLGFRQDAGEHLVYYAEGVETTVSVFHVPLQNYRVSFVDGRIEVPTDAVSMRAFRALGHLPPLVRPQAERALMLSFGNGIATGALDTHDIPHIEAVDLSREMLEAAAHYWEENYNVLHSPRLTLHVEDGRNFLLRTPYRYDIITTDATHPANTSSWALFTDEFYTQVAAHLTPTGVFFQWLPFHSMTPGDYRRILRTFQHTFPYASLWYTGGSHSLLMATATPFEQPELDRLLERLVQHPIAHADLESLSRVRDYFVLDAAGVQAFAGPGPIVTDQRVFFAPSTDHVQAIALALLAARLE